MKIRKFKRKFIILSLVLILAGTLISIAGFGVTGFNYNNLKESASNDAWYQTIHIGNDNISYGFGYRR